MKKMGIDAKRAFLNKTGLGQYSRWMLKYYEQSDLFDQSVLFTPKVGPYHTPKPKIEQVVTPSSLQLGSIWRSFQIPKLLSQGGITSYHGLTNELPFLFQNNNIRKTVTIHDVLFKKIPETYRFVDQKIYDIKTRHACNIANDIIVVSEQTKHDLIKHYQTPSKKIHVIYQDCHEQFRNEISSKSKEAYILSVGTVEPRKNHHLLIKALEFMPPHMKVCIAGKKTIYGEELLSLAKNLGVENRVQFIFDFKFEKLPEIIHNAKMCCYLSENEGFGIPILEYMAMKKPVVLADTSLSREVAGDAGVYTSLDVKELAKTVTQLDGQAERVRELCELSKKRAAAFKTPQLYRQLDQLFEKQPDLVTT